MVLINLLPTKLIMETSLMIEDSTTKERKNFLPWAKVYVMATYYF